MQVVKNRSTIPLKQISLCKLILAGFLLLAQHIVVAQVGLQLGAFDMLESYETLKEAPNHQSQFPKTSSLWNPDLSQNSTSKNMNLSTYNYHDLAFFCKIEVQLEKKSKFPMKFRLGDVQYVDWLEGKRDFEP